METSTSTNTSGSEIYQLSLHADKLRRRFLGFRRTPYARVTIDGQEIGKTEVREASLDPDWCQTIKFEFSRGTKVAFVVSIYDCVNHGKQNQKHNDKDNNDNINININDKLLAKAEFEVLEVVQSPGHMQMKEDESNGTQIFVDIQESVQGPSQGYIKLHLRGLDIKNVEPGLLGLGRSDPFFEISKKNSDHTSGIVRWNSVYRSEHIIDHLNPFWEEFTIGLEELCYCNLDWPLRISVYDWEKSGKHRLIGHLEATVQQMVNRIVVRGNADWQNGFELNLDEKGILKGLINILKAEVTVLDENSPILPPT